MIKDFQERLKRRSSRRIDSNFRKKIEKNDRLATQKSQSNFQNATFTVILIMYFYINYRFLKKDWNKILSGFSCF